MTWVETRCAVAIVRASPACRKERERTGSDLDNRRLLAGARRQLREAAPAGGIFGGRAGPLWRGGDEQRAAARNRPSRGAAPPPRGGAAHPAAQRLASGGARRGGRAPRAKLGPVYGGRPDVRDRDRRGRADRRRVELLQHGLGGQGPGGPQRAGSLPGTDRNRDPDPPGSRRYRPLGARRLELPLPMGAPSTVGARGAASAPKPAGCEQARRALATLRPPLGPRRRRTVRAPGHELRTGSAGGGSAPGGPPEVRRTLRKALGPEGGLPGRLLPGDWPRRSPIRRGYAVRLRLPALAPSQGGSLLRPVDPLQATGAHELRGWGLADQLQRICAHRRRCDGERRADSRLERGDTGPHCGALLRRGRAAQPRLHSLYSRLESLLLRFERATEHPDETPQFLGSARSLVVGMGRTGTAAYEALYERRMSPVGLDSDPAKIELHRREGRRVIYGDAEDPELLDHLDLDRLEAVIVAVPDFEARMRAVEGLRKRGFTGVIGTIGMYPEEEAPLREAGADLVRHPLSEAGFGLAEQSLELRVPARGSR